MLRWVDFLTGNVKRPLMFELTFPNKPWSVMTMLTTYCKCDLPEFTSPAHSSEKKTTTFHFNRKWLLTPHNIRTFLSPPWIVAPRAFRVCLRNSGWPGHAAPVTRLPSVKQAEMGLGSFQIPPAQTKEFVKSQNNNVQHFHGHSLWKVTFSKAVQRYW